MLRGFHGSSAQHLLPGFGERNLGARREPDRGELPLNWRRCRHVIRDPAGGGPVDPKVQDPVGSVNEGGAPLCSPEAVTDSTPHIGEASSVHQEFRSLLGRVDAAG